MKMLFAGTVAVTVSLVSSAAFAGRDETQIRQQERAIAAKRAQTEKAGRPATPSELLKRFHPKHAYGH